VDSGIGKDEDLGGEGYVKISCEDFPDASQNLKWISDTLDRMLAAANSDVDKFADVAIDIRHLVSKGRKAKKGEHRFNRVGKRPTIADFPTEWLH